jgi:endo-alpha-1,4-polygalactosaminidase (GH114 family)
MRRRLPFNTKSSDRACRWVSVIVILSIVIGTAVGIPLGLHLRTRPFSSSSPPSASSPSTTPAITTPNNTHISPIWKPRSGTTWQIVLLNPPTLPKPRSESPQFGVWDIDLFDNPASTISEIHDLNGRAICYFSAGTYEKWRPDASQFQPSDLGSSLSGWPGERWLNVLSTNVRNIMLARLDLAATKGCDGVDPDNVDGYANDNGFGLTNADAVAYINFLASAAHSRNLSIGLKNAGDIVPDVIDQMEWSAQEQCIQYNDCDSFRPFIDQGKPVFHVEYPKGADTNNNDSITTDQKTSICTNETAKGFSTILKNMDLDQWIETC